MCGIAGIFSTVECKLDSSIIHNMVNLIQHRGPDDVGFYVSNCVALGMRRLSIIDVEGGHQPITTQDNNQVIVFNGEIYNFRSLRNQLIKKGYHFETNTDTEVILKLYQEYGTEVVNYLRGMFAFAIWDAEKNHLFLARDRVGIKPLYYTYQNNVFTFGSEIKSILGNPSVDKSINYSALGQYLSVQYVPGPETIFNRIYKLPAGHTLTLTKSGINLNSYWHWPERVEYTTRSEKDLVEEILDLLKESIDLRMISDVPLGAFLSGGIDSSTIVGLMEQKSSGPLKTFSVGFNTHSKYDETPYARQVANYFDTDHHELILGSETIRLLPKLVWHLDEPLADRAALPTYLVSKLARRHVKVVLTGEGGDELFAGYRRYTAVGLHYKYLSLPSTARNGVGKIFSNLANKPNLLDKYQRLTNPHLFDMYMGQQANFSPVAKQNLLSKAFAEEININSPFKEWGEVSRTSWLRDLLDRDAKSWLPDDLLMKADKMSMAASIEARVPFLDHKLIELISTIPTNMNIKNMTTKYLLKQSVRDVVPKKIIQRRKQGFDVPLSAWFHENVSFIQDILLSPSADRGYFNLDYIESMIDHVSSDPKASPSIGGQIWNLICLELWHKIYIDNDKSWLEVKVNNEYIDN